jgi:phage terminase large subunit-like protein
MSLATDIAELKRFRVSRQLAPIDPEQRERYDWYAESCPCGLAPGECRTHPRARPAQRPPAGDWRVFVYSGGRGTGKSRSGVEWLLDRIRRGVCRHGLAIGATAADLRDVLVEGPSGILSVSPPWDRPRYEPSKRRLTWNNGARVTLLSGEEPDRCRGLNIDTLLADELPHWAHSRETWDLAMLALRAGTDPRAMVTTTPKRNPVLLRILDEPTTVKSVENTYANVRHLAPQFIDEITALYRGTRFAAQEIEGQMLESVEGCWFARFDRLKHVQLSAEYVFGIPVEIAVDAGTSRTTAAVFYQTERIDDYRVRFRIIGDYLAVDKYSAENANAILALFRLFCPGARIHNVWIDPASSARTSIGPTALAEYQQVFGARFVNPSPGGSVTDGLDSIEAMLDRGDLIIHPRCLGLIDGFVNYARASRQGDHLDVPALNQSPYEDSIDALRYGIRGTWPEGRRPQPAFERRRPGAIF